MSSETLAERPTGSTGRSGVMLVIASPSGAGKSTLSRMLLQQDRAISMSISATTRPRRPSEVDGFHYHFVSRTRFESMRAGGELLEWAENHGNLYGTPRAPVEQALAEGRDLLFDIDYKGTLQLYEKMRAGIVSVFILPPSAGALKARLERRAEDSPQVINRRLKTALTELKHWHCFDHIVVNDDLDATFQALRGILAAARCATRRNSHLGALAANMEHDLSEMVLPDEAG